VNVASAEATTARITQAGGTAIAIGCDVGDRSEIESLISSTVERCGQIDVLVNSAGVTARNAPEGADFEEAWDFVMNVNLKGTMLACKFAVDAMQVSGGGSIINLSSIYGLVGRPAGLSNPFDPYPHSKGAIVLLTKNLAVALAKDDIRVNCLCPGFVHTALTQGLTQDKTVLDRLESLHPQGRLGTPDEIANAALFLASDESSFVTGTSLIADGGYAAQ
jgi:NAD(P)-dependent dehydrogenase (short-subunit alcohol dehydrogenase family)